MFSTFAAIAPSAMASRVRSARAVGRWPVNEPVGLSTAAAPLTVAEAAPAASSRTQDTNTPRPDHRATAFLLVSGAK